jgi:hypothetical protein
MLAIGPGHRPELYKTLETVTEKDIQCPDLQKEWGSRVVSARYLERGRRESLFHNPTILFPHSSR